MNIAKYTLNYYPFWLLLISLACLITEHIKPWRKKQPFLHRKQIKQDLFWLIFNGVIAAWCFQWYFKYLHQGYDSLFLLITHQKVAEIRIIANQPLWLQVIIVLVTADLMEWCIHNFLHRNKFLWKIHRMHHSILIMDWIGNFRFHWGEIIIYNTIKYLPLAVLGANGPALLITSIISTGIGHINHSNLKISWGFLRYILNSPCMHIYHHERNLRKPAGVNFGIVFSLWDWVFNTAFMPQNAEMPEKLGYKGDEKVSKDLFTCFFLPLKR